MFFFSAEEIVPSAPSVEEIVPSAISEEEIVLIAFLQRKLYIFILVHEDIAVKKERPSPLPIMLWWGKVLRREHIDTNCSFWKNK